MSDFLPKSPCVGENVVWFPHGDTNQEPFAATVTSRINDDCITLYTLSPTGRREPMLNVKHVTHPDHDHSPQGLKRWGAWDLIGEHEKRKQEIKEQKLVKKAKALKEAEKPLRVDMEEYENPDEQEMIVIQLSRGLSESPGRAKQVADKIGSGMTHQRVNSILRKFPHLLKGEMPEGILEANV